MSKILITGGAGYIGSMLCTKLLEEGHSVTAVDLLKYDKGSLNHLYFNKRFTLIRADIRKVSLMRKLLKNHDIIINVSKKEWKSGLENALEYYIEGEEYEQCSKVRDLINKL